LTDNEPGGSGVRVLEWDAGQGIRVVAVWPEEAEGRGDGEETMDGGSHAVWLDY
jgi:hypothetical protein